MLYYIFLLEYGTSAYVIIRVFSLLFALLICIHFQIAVVIPHYLLSFLHLVEIHSIHYCWAHITAKFILLYSNSFFCNAS